MHRRAVSRCLHRERLTTIQLILNERQNIFFSDFTLQLRVHCRRSSGMSLEEEGLDAETIVIGVPTVSLKGTIPP